MGMKRQNPLLQLIEGGLIVFAGGAIVKMAVEHFVGGSPPQRMVEGIGLLAGVGALYGGWGLWLRKQGDALQSPAIRSEAEHILSDVKTTWGVIIGGGIAGFSGYSWIDSVVALGVAIHVVWIGISLIRESVFVLMDQAVDKQVEKKIWETLRTFEGRVVGAHHIRTRSTGSRIFWISIWLWIPT